MNDYGNGELFLKMLSFPFCIKPTIFSGPGGDDSDSGGGAQQASRAVCRDQSEVTMTKERIMIDSNDDDEDTKNDHLSGSQAGPHGGREREHGAAQAAGAEDPRAGVQVGAGEDHQAEAGHTSGQAEGGERHVDITWSYQLPTGSSKKTHFQNHHPSS